jgi:hypothetical protein
MQWLGHRIADVVTMIGPILFIGSGGETEFACRDNGDRKR